MNFAIPLMSFLVGLLIGLTSLGGAALMAPFLILVVGVRPVLAVGTDLAYGTMTKLIGAWMHWRQGTVDIKLATRLALGSVPGALLGLLVVVALPRQGLDVDLYVRRAIGIVLILVAAMLLAWMAGGQRTIGSGATLERFRGLGAALWGLIAGFCVGLTSVGSGALIAPFLMLLHPISPAKVVGTDVFHAAILVCAAGLAHSAAGNVDWHLVPLLLVGSVPGVILGSRLAPRLPVGALRVGLAILLLATGIRLV